MTIFKTLVTIEFDDLVGPNVSTWLDAMDAKNTIPSRFPDLECRIPVDIDIGEFSDKELPAEFQRRFGLLEDQVEAIYRAIAEGNNDVAMDRLAGDFSLPSPEHEKRIAAVIARGRAKEASHA